MTLTSTKPGLHAAGDLPLHPTLHHPRTGLPLQAIGFRRDGRAIWPQLGGDGTDPPTDPPKPSAPPADPPKDPPAPPADPKDEPLGEAGKKALDAERAARKELEKRLAALAPLEKLAQALGGGDADKGKTEVEQLNERLATQEQAIAEERTARWRAEVQADKKLTAAQAARLVGSTKEDLAKDADALLAAFGGAKPDEEQGNGRQRRSSLKPDPGQGAREGDQATSLDSGRSLYAERHKKKPTTST